MLKNWNYAVKPIKGPPLYNYYHHHTINRAAFVCLSVCSFDGSSPNLVGVCRWTLELPLRGSFLKRSTGQRVKRKVISSSKYTH